MKLELPAADAIHSTRAPAPRPRGRALRRLKTALLFCLAAAAVLTAGIMAAGYLSRPRIDRIEPAIGEPGGIIRIEGRSFGTERGDSSVELDGVSPTSASYLSWNDSSISVRMPASVDSGLVRVVTRSGRSNPKLFMNRARLPVRAEGDRSGRGGPLISSLSTEVGPIGSLLVINGLDFGASRETGSVAFSWSPENGPGPQLDDAGSGAVSLAETDLGYELWSDKQIKVRVPDGAVSGAVSVIAAKGRSNGLFFRVTSPAGAKRFTERRSYSISNTVSITKVKASGGNELYLWVPLPADFSGQRLLRVLAQEPPPFVPSYRGSALYRLKDLQTGTDLSLTQSLLVSVYTVETDVDSERVQAAPEDPPALMAAYTAPDDRIASGAPEIMSLAKRIVGSERNPWKATRLVWDWMLRNIGWKEGSNWPRLQDALAHRSADSYSYALLCCSLLRAAGVPALPVAGYLIDSSRKAVRHYWVEIYLYGLGWVPLDPVLGTGASPGRVAVAWDERSRYLGNLDNRHLAFSRGTVTLAPMASDGRRTVKERSWSLQNFYEEASGGLDAYSSFWGDVEVTGLY